MQKIFTPRLLTGSGELLNNALLEIADGKVHSLSPGVDKELLGNETEVLPMGTTMLPGLIDCHVHLALDGEDFHRSLARWQSNEAWKPMVARELLNTLAAGVVGIRDGSDAQAIGLKAKEFPRPRPEIVACGRAISEQGRYGSFLGYGVSTLTEVQRILDDLVIAGADQLKVVLSGLVSFTNYGKVGRPQFDVDFIKAVVAEAHRRQLPVMAHASGASAVDMAVEAGVDSVEHGFFVTRETIKKMADKEVSWVPTVVAAGGRLKFDRPGEDRTVIERTCETHIEAIALARQLGINVAVGTDAGAPGVPHGASYYQELSYLHKAGYSGRELVTLSTRNGAEVTGLGKLGDLAPGYTASFVIVHGNPLDDAAAFSRVASVYHRGKLLKKA
ncbi:amidohydrolase family protein [Metallumcola ferriviriculae]|uniref:Amidohydrolase family protein n=1 Tax=Metallumcola ferriviriculae TaxID=3039180 RepID=A0AAU0UJ95_9FIRM|nr:amidohydrolase family protein [Desulfitibacteraceae bacterium MK1]